MRDPGRIDEILSDLAELWRREPDTRLGQLIVNLVEPEDRCASVFGIEDAALHKRMRRALNAPQK